MESWKEVSFSYSLDYWLPLLIWFFFTWSYLRGNSVDFDGTKGSQRLEKELGSFVELGREKWVEKFIVHTWVRAGMECLQYARNQPRSTGARCTRNQASVNWGWRGTPKVHSTRVFMMAIQVFLSVANRVTSWENALIISKVVKIWATEPITISWPIK